MRDIKALNNHLFAQLEKLNNEDIEGEKLKEEIERSKALCSISGQIINLGNLALNAEKLKEDSGATGFNSIPLLGGNNG